MSVAFRRESDEEHKEPRFELPIAPGPNLVTMRGLGLIAAKVAELEGAVATATDDARRDVLKRELRYWHTRQTTAEVSPPPVEGVVGIGSRVTLRLNGATRDVIIVGGDEAEPATGRISFQAPLARAVLGGTVGEKADFNGAAEAVEIIAVEDAG